MCELLRLASRGLMEMDALKDERRRVLETLGLGARRDAVAANAPMHVIVKKVVDHLHNKITQRFVQCNWARGAWAHTCVCGLHVSVRVRACLWVCLFPQVSLLFID